MINMEAMNKTWNDLKNNIEDVINIGKDNKPHGIISRIIEWNKERKLDKQPYVNEVETLNMFEEVLEASSLPDDLTKEYFNDPENKNVERYLAQNLIKELKEKGIIFENISDDKIIDSLADRVIFSIGAMIKLGYKPTLVMDETLKEIESRTGSIQDGKFVKDQSNEAKSKWYEADYNSCKTDK